MERIQSSRELHKDLLLSRGCLGLSSLLELTSSKQDATYTFYLTLLSRVCQFSIVHLMSGVGAYIIKKHPTRMSVWGS